MPGVSADLAEKTGFAEIAQVVNISAISPSSSPFACCILMSLAEVPIELLQEILEYALSIHTRPGELLCVNKTFFNLGQPILHAHLNFNSIFQLIRFAESPLPLACHPRTMIIALAGGTADFEVFKYLALAFRRCLGSRVTPRRHLDGDGCKAYDCCEEDTKVPLDLLSLRLHSHNGNPHLNSIYEALALAK